MRIEDDLLRLLLSTIIPHTANLQEALAVTTCDLCAVVIELAVVDILLVLGVNRVHVVLRSLLGGINAWLLGRLGATWVTHDRTWHHLLLVGCVIKLLCLLRGSSCVHAGPLVLLLMLLSSVHFCFSFRVKKV